MSCQHLSYAQYVTLTRRKRFKNPYVAAAIVMAESGGDTCAKNVNSDGSIDRGAFQINSVHGKLSTYNLDKNLDAAFEISNGGTDWSAWVTFQNGAYKQYVKPGTKGAPVKGLGGHGIGGGTGHGATAVGTGGAIDSPEHRSEALKALVWVLFVLGGAGLVLFGAARAVGLKRPLEVAATGKGSGSPAPAAAAPAASRGSSRTNKPARAAASYRSEGVPF